MIPGPTCKHPDNRRESIPYLDGNGERILDPRNVLTDKAKMPITRCMDCGQEWNDGKLWPTPPPVEPAQP